MKILERLFGGRLAPSWELTPGATIWKLEVTAGGRLVGESRDVESKRMTLFAIDLDRGALIFSGCALEEPWWLALDGVVGELAIVHRYPKPDMPNVLGTTVVDATTGATLWSDPTLRVICGAEEILLAQRGASNDAPRLAFVDARTGATLGDADDERAAAFHASCDEAARWSGWTAADELAEDEPRMLALRPVIDREIAERRGPVEVADVDGVVVASGYARSRQGADAMLQGLLDNIIVVVAGGRVVYRETIATRLPAPTGDSFFVRNGVLHFVRHGCTLVGLDLRAAR